MPFDYVIGSVHFIDGWGLMIQKRAGASRWGLGKLYEKLLYIAPSPRKIKDFNITEHPDSVKKLGHKLKADVNGLYLATAEVFKKIDVYIKVVQAVCDIHVGDISQQKFS